MIDHEPFYKGGFTDSTVAFERQNPPSAGEEAMNPGTVSFKDVVLAEEQMIEEKLLS